jgi:uncharacterized protein (DUF302 family)
MPANAQNGLLTMESHHSVDETVNRFEKILQAKGIKLFAVIDHSGEAAKAGLQMRSTKVLVFGNPRAGTPLMVAVPDVAIDLPMKALIREDADGKVWISWNSAAYLQVRHGLPEELVQTYIGTVVDALARGAAE